MLREKLSPVKSPCGVSKELAVSKSTCPENGVLTIRLEASRAGVAA